MTGCTIIISHFESLSFLRACIRQIRKFAQPEIEQKIFIIDQSGEKIHGGVMYEYYGDPDIKIMRTKPYYSGYGIDWAMRYGNIQTSYICQLHVDAFPISKNWLHLPIKLIEENNLSFVGQLQCIADGKASIYPPSPFFAMAQCFNVAKTETYKELSYMAGFTRFHARENDKKMFFANDDWTEWAKEDYITRGSDDDVVAFHWEDKYREHDKLGLAITGFIQPSFGRIIEDIVLHFGSCRESIGVIDSMPELYRQYTKKINDSYTDELISEMITLAKTNQPPQREALGRNFWNGKTKTSSPPPTELNKRIEELKNG